MDSMKRKSHVKRVFVNDVDAYSSRHIAEVLVKPGAEEESEDDESPSPWDEPAFQIIGTVSSTEGEKLPFLHQKYVSPSRDELLQLLLECDVVVYNVTESSTQQQVEEATWAVTALLNEMENFKSRKYFILVSSVMTWAMSKPKEADEAEDYLSEEEFIRRRPHPSFRKHNNLEKLVLKLPRGKTSKLKGYVVGAGLQYGMGEDIFHYFFKVSWLLQDPKVPIFGNGTNYIPMIHVGDLGRVIQNVIKLKPKSKYILAVDESHNTLEDVVKAISNVLGPEKVCKVPLEDAITMKAFKPEELDCLSINLRMDAAVDSDTFSFNWICRDGMVENMENIADEYKRARQLLPIKIFLVGPPAAGKTTVAEKLCQLYKLNHINISRMIEEKTTKLKDLINEAELDDVHEEAAAAAQQQLEIINQSMEKNQGQLDESLIFEILREKLYSKPCRNQGFVLDGFPETFEQAKVIFSDEEPVSQDSELISKIPRYNKIITPEHVFVLEASDDFLMRRVQGLPQSTAEKMSYTQEEFVPRLARYRQLFCTQETLLDFFDYREIHPQYIEINSEDLEYAGVMKKITEDVGVPRNYSPNPEEQKDENRRKEEEIKQKLVPETEEKKIRKTAALAEMTKHYEEWKKNLSVVEQEESELLEAKALPLRNYLMKYVMPSLSAAMLECSKIKPEDPVDFLAEHLLQNNQDN
ncbi:PREDICTED: adenylate kinase 7-like [Cyprinodon variegatus]|uniref:adenylate kinase 7-like n=1 Tax=Cyprinodon variegatus TaxID=28743 RepID=UPI000742B7A0|nr:PREDICTED: adenylate kinase 7-like [Cyprinodon variegatus]